MRLTDCGRITRPSVCRRVSPSARAPSHCPGGDRADRAAHDLRRVGHHGQREAQDRLGPVGERDAQTEDADLEGDQEHAQEQQHQPGRVAEELGDDTRAAPAPLQSARAGRCPTGTPATVPTAIAISEIRMLKAKPHSSSGAQRIEHLAGGGLDGGRLLRERNGRADANDEEEQQDRCGRWPGGRPSPRRAGVAGAGTAMSPPAMGLAPLLAESGDDEAALDGVQDADQDEHQRQIGERARRSSSRARWWHRSRSAWRRRAARARRWRRRGWWS